jgi:hypothetical protein
MKKKIPAILIIDREIHLNPINILLSFFFAIAVVLFFDYFRDFSVDTFDRIIGQAVSHNISVEKRIAHYYILYFIIFPISFYCGICLVNFIRKKYVSDNFLIKKIDPILIKQIYKKSLNFFLKYSESSSELTSKVYLVLLISVFLYQAGTIILKYFIHNSSLSIFNYSITVNIIFVQFLITLWYHLHGYKTLIAFDLMIWCFITSLIPSLLVYWTIGGIDTRYSNILYCLIYFLLNITVLVLINKYFKNRSLLLVIHAFKPMACFLWISALFILFCVSLSGFGIQIPYKIVLIYLIFMCLLTASVLRLVRNKNNSDKNSKSLYYLNVLIGILIIAWIPSIKTVTSTDFFESANVGLIVSEFFNWGKIPILETFNAHMLSDSFENILFAFINHDSIGGVLGVYSGFSFILIALLTYWLLRKYYGPDTVFFSMVFFLTISIEYRMLFGILSLITLLYFLEKKSFLSGIIFWISCAIVSLFSLDIGVSFVGSAVLILIISSIIYKDKYLSTSAILSFFCLIAFCFLFLMILCHYRNLNPFLWIKEFISVTVNSNASWAFTYLIPGVENHPILSNIIYSITYIFFPLVITLLFFILSSIKFYHIRSLDYKSYLILVFLFLAYIINIQRGLVRHSVRAYEFHVVYWVALFYICITISILLYKWKNQIFVISMLPICFIISIHSIVKGNDKLLILDKMFNNSVYEIITRDTISIKRDITNDMVNKFDDLKVMLNATLNNKETYIDFTNQTLLYALMGYEKPVYVNQSPALLSGESSQSYYIEDILEGRNFVCCAILPADNSIPFIVQTDGLQNSYRYYLLAENIFSNYKPMYVSDSFAVWYRNDIFDNILAKIQTNPSLNDHFQLIDNIYYKNLDLHNYDLDDLAWIWGMHDKRNAWENKVLTELSINGDSYIVFEPEKILTDNNNKGNYIELIISSFTNSTAQLDMGCFTNKFDTYTTFNFNIVTGKNIRYIIRSSSDFNWYTTDLNMFRFSCSDNVDIESVLILEGD